MNKVKITSQKLRKIISEELDRLREDNSHISLVTKMIKSVQKSIAEGLATDVMAPEIAEGDGLNYMFKVNLSTQPYTFKQSVDGKENNDLTVFVIDKLKGYPDYDSTLDALASKKFGIFKIPITVIPPTYKSEELDFDAGEW